MEITRTANAGILLTMDGTQLLLDGVCREVAPYLGTTPAQWQQLTSNLPAAVAFTHTHADHFHPDYAQVYKTATGGDCILPGREGECEVAKLRLAAVPTRHLGKAGGAENHCSYVVRGSKTLWFMGDAAPGQLKLMEKFPKPEVLVVPFGFLLSDSAIALVKTYLPCAIVLVHMPDKNHDPEGIWDAVAPGIHQLAEYLYTPDLGETISL